MLINIVGFNLCWFGLVWFGNDFIPFACLFLLMHLYYSNVRREHLLIITITFTGILVDSLLYGFGFYQFEQLGHIPFWLMVLWACFATTIAHSLHFLSVSKCWQMIVGAMFVPLSYIAGYQFGAVVFSHPILISYVALSLIWCLLLPLFFLFKKHITA